MHGNRENGYLCEASIPTSLLRYLCKLAAVNESGTKSLYLTLPTELGRYDKASVTSFGTKQRR